MNKLQTLEAIVACDHLLLGCITYDQPEFINQLKIIYDVDYDIPLSYYDQGNFCIILEHLEECKRPQLLEYLKDLSKFSGPKNGGGNTGGGKKVSIEGQEYKNIARASEALFEGSAKRTHSRTITNRCKSDKWPTWYFVVE